MKIRASLSLLVALLSAQFSLPAVSADKPLYRLKAIIPLGLGEHWDYVTFDQAHNRIYVAHGDHVDVVDPHLGRIVGKIGPLPGGTHGIAILPDENLGLTDDGTAGIAAFFNLQDYSISKKVVTAPDADGIVYDHSSQRMFVINGDSGSITVVDPRSKATIGKINVGAGLEAGVADNAGHLYVDGVDNHDVVVVNTKTNAVTAHYPMPSCVRPHGIALNPQQSTLFVTCVNKAMVILDGRNGKIMATIPIGSGSDGVVFDPKRRVAISSNGDGTLTVVRQTGQKKFSLAGEVMTWPSARTIALDPATGNLFLPAADTSSVEKPSSAGRRPKSAYVPGSLKLLLYQPLD